MHNSLQLSAKSVGVFEAFYNSIKPVTVRIVWYNIKWFQMHESDLLSMFIWSSLILGLADVLHTGPQQGRENTKRYASNASCPCFVTWDTDQRYVNRALDDLFNE